MLMLHPAWIGNRLIRTPIIVLCRRTVASQRVSQVSPSKEAVIGESASGTDLCIQGHRA